MMAMVGSLVIFDYDCQSCDYYLILFEYCFWKNENDWKNPLYYYSCYHLVKGTKSGAMMTWMNVLMALATIKEKREEDDEY